MLPNLHLNLCGLSRFLLSLRTTGAFLLYLQACETLTFPANSDNQTNYMTGIVHLGFLVIPLLGLALFWLCTETDMYDRQPGIAGLQTGDFAWPGVQDFLEFRKTTVKWKEAKCAK